MSSSEHHHAPSGREIGAAQVRQEGSHFGPTEVSGGFVFQGNFAGLTISELDFPVTIVISCSRCTDSTAAARPEYAGQFSHSTLEPVKAYVSRPLLHDQIRTQLCDNSVGNSAKVLVVWGLGGAGKTQLVLDYMRQHRTEYRATFWIEAGLKESLERDFIHLYQTLSGVSMGTGRDTVSFDDAVTWVKSWFASRTGPRLMVFDGADTIDDTDASGYINIKHCIPNVASLHVIITSRSSTAKDMTTLEGVQVSEMEKTQAVELFFGPLNYQVTIQRSTVK